MVSKLQIKSEKKHQLIDFTDKVQEILKRSKNQEGSVLIFAQHTTCALIISGIEDNLESDFLTYFEKEGPNGPFQHSHGTSASHTPAHLLSAIIGQTVQIPIENGRMTLGTWQRICLLELDGPRNREIIVQIK